MKKTTTTEAEVARFRQDIQSKLRSRVLEAVLDEERGARCARPRT